MIYLLDSYNNIVIYPTLKVLIDQRIKVNLNPITRNGVMAIDGHTKDKVSYHPTIEVIGEGVYSKSISYSEGWTKSEVERDVIEFGLKEALDHYGYKVLKEYCT